MAYRVLIVGKMPSAALRLTSLLRFVFVAAMMAAAAPAMSATTPNPAAERILDDSGGRIESYLSRYQALRKSGHPVAIDGTCASACTLLLGVIPHNRICVTPRAVLAFHAAWDLSWTGAKTNAPATKFLLSRYPDDVRRWIARHGGLRSQTIYLGGRELAAMFPTCH
jgi:hypothetical protein